MDDARRRQRQQEARRLLRALRDGEPMLITETGELHEHRRDMLPESDHETTTEFEQRFLGLHPRDQEVIGNLMRAFVARRETGETPALDQAVRALWDLFAELMPRLACAGCGREGLRSNFDERTIDCPACGLLILQLREPPNAAPIPGAARGG